MNDFDILCVKKGKDITIKEHRRQSVSTLIMFCCLDVVKRHTLFFKLLNIIPTAQ